MNNYIINLVVDTKNTDIYDKVALNKYPIIVSCKDEDELRKILSSDNSKNYIKKHIKSQKVYDTAEWFIRHFISFDNTDEIRIKLTELSEY